jgi:phosphoribosylformylglycinamidine (FGAM) synthase-like amidotransferase family enzyme
MTTPKALVIAGDGINCEIETGAAFRMVGFDVEIRHLNDLIAESLSIDEVSIRYQVVAFPGGFSFGDELTSGKVLALKIQHGLGWDLSVFAARGGLVLGVCNGFQALIRMGVFGKDLSITQNESGVFQNQWVKVTPFGSRCLWLRGIGTIDLPIRHGEGRIIVASTRRKEVLDKMERLGMLCLRYEGNPNGSELSLAGLCDSSGRILGVMPHPESFTRWTAHPEWTVNPGSATTPGQGLLVFENAYQEAVRSMG